MDCSKHDNITVINAAFVGFLNLVEELRPLVGEQTVAEALGNDAIAQVLLSILDTLYGIKSDSTVIHAAYQFIEFFVS